MVKDFGDVYGEYWDMVYGFLFRLCQNEHFAEELAQETFLRAMRAWDSFRGDSSVSTWLCAIAKRLYYSSLRKTPVLPIDELPMGATPDIAEQLLDGDRQMIVQHILHQLPEPYREVFTLRTLCDLSHGQIGELFGKSDNWARVTYYRAKTRIQTMLEQQK